MDPIKESLIHAAGTLDEHEANVHAKVLSSVQAKLKKKQKIKWFSIWIPAIALASFMVFFAVQMMQPSPVELRTASHELTKEDYQFLYEIMQSTKSTDPAEYKFNFVAHIALPYYAEIMDITLNEKELTRRVKEQIAEFKKSETYESESNAKFYESIFIPFIEEASYSEELLLKQLKTEYPTFNLDTLEKLLYYNAIQYFMTLNEAKMFASNEELASIIDIANMNAKVTIIQIEKDYMVAVENGNYFELNGLSTEQIASFRNVYKIPVGLLNGVNVGSTTELVFWQDKYAEHIIEILPFSSANSFISFEIDYPTSTSFLSLIEDLQWTKGTTFENATHQLLGILFENQHYIIQFNSTFDQFTIYDMLDEEKTIVPEQLNSQLIDIIKMANYPSIDPPQN